MQRPDSPIALGWVDPDVSDSYDWDLAAVRRLGRQLGYVVIWPPENTRVPAVDQVRSACADVVIAPASTHFDVVTLNSILSVVDIETAAPRMSFPRWTAIPSRMR